MSASGADVCHADESLCAPVMLAQAIGGAVAVVVGVCMTDFTGMSSGRNVDSGQIYVEDSVVAMTQSNFTNCAA